MVAVSLSSNIADRKLIASNDVTCKGCISPAVHFYFFVKYFVIRYEYNRVIHQYRFVLTMPLQFLLQTLCMVKQ